MCNLAYVVESYDCKVHLAQYVVIFVGSNSHVLRCCNSNRWWAEVESSRTDFEVLGLGLEASSPRKLACPRLEDSTIFWFVKILWSAWKIFWKKFFCRDRLKNFCEDLFFIFGEHLCLCPWSLASSIPVLGLESVCPRKGCPWPWPRIFFVSLALASSLVSSTPPLLMSILVNNKLYYQSLSFLN